MNGEKMFNRLKYYYINYLLNDNVDTYPTKTKFRLSVILRHSIFLLIFVLFPVVASQMVSPLPQSIKKYCIII